MTVHGIAHATPSPEVSTAARWGARAGLAARGAIYVLVAIVALSLALRGHGGNADQKGAVTDLASKPFGAVLVVLLMIGLAAYCLWQLSQVAFGVVGEEDTTGKRLRSLGSGVVYAGLAFTCGSVLAGARRSQSSQQQGVTAKVMHHTGGRWLVGIVGAAIIVVGIVLVVQGVKATFLERMSLPPGDAGRAVKRLGQVGTAARGVVFAVAGFLVVDAAWTYQPQKARGLDGAFQTLLHQPYGRWLTGLAALGLLAFGLFGLAESRYRRV